MVTLYVSGGLKDKLRPGDILGALTGEAGGLPGSDVGKIEIHERSSYVTIAPGSAGGRAIERLGAGQMLPSRIMAKNQDARKNVKKAPTRTPKEKKELKRIKKAGK